MAGFPFRALTRWYAEGRRDLPWRRTRDPYAVLVSETMLQQTRVQTVVPYYERFLRELPDVRALAEAPEEKVLSLWSGLGYYRRARLLQDAARSVVAEHAGTVPDDAAALRRLPGIGRYTAAAVASIAFDRREALVDGNVARVLARLFAVREDVKSAAGRARLWDLADALVAGLPADASSGDWNQALMELGATVCVPGAPRCASCPVAAACRARALGIEAELPVSAAKREPLLARRVAVVLSSSRSVLLARRRAGVLFGGLWEPPGDERDGLAGLLRRLGLRRGDVRAAGEVVHVLTHRRLQVEVLAGPLGRRRTWALPGADYDAVEPVPLEEVTPRAHSTFARKVLAAAGLAGPARPPAAGRRLAR